jgi:hypothetical protein
MTEYTEPAGLPDGEYDDYDEDDIWSDSPCSWPIEEGS